jgi:hypothetical protein
MAKVLYVVTFIERERGWGQTSWKNEYKTRKAAQKAIDECNKANEDDWNKTRTVPDYYIQANDVIELKEVHVVKK